MRRWDQNPKPAHEVGASDGADGHEIPVKKFIPTGEREHPSDWPRCGQDLTFDRAWHHHGCFQPLYRFGLLPSSDLHDFFDMDFPFGDSLFSDLFPSAWPLGYLISSRYSPLALERDGRLGCQGTTRWRDAFEDLMLAEQGKPLPARQRSETGEDKRESPEQWITGLLNRGVLGPWKRIEEGTVSDGARTPTADGSSNPVEDVDGQTELDLYNRFLGSQYSSEDRPMPDKGSVVEPEKPSIISTLTTTERKTLPDGSVYTKVVLKKRFADGNEESSETVHTTAPRQDFAHNLSDADADADGSPSSGRKEKKGGWFWSK